MVKAVLLMLVVIAALAVFGRIRVGNPLPKAKRRCPSCKRPLIGNGPCICRTGRAE